MRDLEIVLCRWRDPSEAPYGVFVANDDHRVALFTHQ